MNVKIRYPRIILPFMAALIAGYQVVAAYLGGPPGGDTLKNKAQAVQ